MLELSPYTWPNDCMCTVVEVFASAFNSQDMKYREEIKVIWNLEHLLAAHLFDCCFSRSTIDYICQVGPL